MVNLTVLVLLALAAYRVTRLIVIDAIFDETREWFFKKLDFKKVKGSDTFVSRNLVAQKLSYLLQCTWCTGVWVSTGIYLIWAGEWYGWDSAISIAAIAGAQGMIHALEPSDD